MLRRHDIALTSVAGKAAKNNVNNKRKRGRPKKNENVQLEPIQRVVSASDSDNNSNNSDSVANSCENLSKDVQ